MNTILTFPLPYIECAQMPLRFRSQYYFSTDEDSGKKPSRDYFKYKCIVLNIFGNLGTQVGFISVAAMAIKVSAIATIPFSIPTLGAIIAGGYFFTLVCSQLGHGSLKLESTTIRQMIQFYKS